jgi:hypothetical protein
MVHDSAFNGYAAGCLLVHLQLAIGAKIHWLVPETLAMRLPAAVQQRCIGI